jgi:predicted N-acyltransferase
VQATTNAAQQLSTRIIESIDELEPSAWNELTDSTYPFIRHEFLSALEATGCASESTGWLPNHLICESATGELLGAMPLYLKSNSYGEFVFDFSWANAYQQAGLSYYPKLVSAIPFTPATGPRILVPKNHEHATAIQGRLIADCIETATDKNYSSWHVLMPDSDNIELLKNRGLLIRKDCQFHWHNNDYLDFDDFLATFTAKKRKKVKRERRRMTEQNIHFEVRSGSELETSDWAKIMPLYRHTFLRRGREPYLGQDFFSEIAKRLPNSLVVFMGFQETELVSVAICFRSETALYGRYWGANEFIDSLHFETCYYQGIDYCIKHGLELYEPGTQGEHKISRGFVPAETWSAHWLLEPRFATAVDEYLERERDYIDEYIDSVGNHIPYRKNDN